MTTHNSRNAGRVYIMVSCAAPEGVYTQRLVLLLEMSTLQRAVLHLHMDVPTPQRPELHLDLHLGSSIPRNIYFEILLSVR